MREFIESVAYCLILAISTTLVVYVGQKLFNSDEVENYEKQIRIKMIEQYQRRITQLEKEVIYYETFCGGLKPIMKEDKK